MGGAGLGSALTLTAQAARISEHRPRGLEQGVRLLPSSRVRTRRFRGSTPWDARVPEIPVDANVLDVIAPPLGQSDHF